MSSAIRRRVTGYEHTPPDSRLDPGGNRESIGELLSDITTDLSTLMRQEVELAKAEVKQSATRASKGAGMLAGAGVAGHFVLLFISIAAWWGIGDSIGHGWSALIIAVIWAVIAAVLSMARAQAAQDRPGRAPHHRDREEESRAL